MNDALDNLFKKRLSDHSLEPGPEAWSRISSSLTKKNNKIIWYRAAAGILLASLLLWFFTSRDNSNTENIADRKSTIEKNSEPVQPIQKMEEESDKNNKDENEATPVPTVESSKPLLAQKKKSQQRNVAKDVTKSAMDDEQAGDPLENIASIETDELIAVTDILEPEKESKPIVIVYELSEINKKPASEFVLEPLPEKRNKLRKVLEVANDVRTGESPLNGLRQAKEEIFAFNFKKDDKKNK